jgi:hypothetical protein
MGAYRINLLAVVFTCFFLASIVGCGLMIYAVLNMSSKDGDQYIITLNGTQKTLSLVSLFFYMLILLPATLFMFIKSNK